MNEQEQEINLRDWIEVIIKYKKLILAIFLISVIATAIVSFLMPKGYRVSMIIEAPVFDISDKGEKFYFDSSENIKAKIESEVFNSKITNKLNLDPKKNRLKFNVSFLANTKLIKINLERNEKQKDLGLKILNQLFDELSNSYKDILESKNIEIEKQIQILSNNIIVKSNEIELHEKNLKEQEVRANKLIDEIKETKNKLEKWTDKIEPSLNKNGRQEEMPTLFYLNIVQQNITYLNQMNGQLAELETSREQMKVENKNLQKEIENLRIEIEKLNLGKIYMHNVKLVKEPLVSEYPIRPNKKLNVVKAGIASLMFGIFLAFFMEYWKKSKSGETK